MNIDKVYSQKYRDSIMSILMTPAARHNQRVWITGFLQHAGYSINEICGIIRHHNHWADYDQEYTSYQVVTVCGRKRRYNKSSQRTPAGVITFSDCVVHFLKTMKKINLTVPSNISDAIAYYSYMGFTVLPKQKNEKRPAVAWQKYIENMPSHNELMGWDFSYGICLLANDDYSFLDVDKAGYEDIFSGWYYERTPRGGLHVFGKGKMDSVNVAGGEIKGKGTLIISYPTIGYQTV